MVNEKLPIFFKKTFSKTQKTWEIVIMVIYEWIVD
jgi:hypothetical protein